MRESDILRLAVVPDCAAREAIKTTVVALAGRMDSTSAGKPLEPRFLFHHRFGLEAFDITADRGYGECATAPLEA